MKKTLVLLIALVSLPLGAAQLYRWVDDKGNVEWRDTPPPASANPKKVEQRTVGSNTIETSTMSYSLQQAVKNHPVTLWAFDCGPPCTDARGLLARRGIPYTEKNAQSNNEALKKLTGSAEVPVLVVGAKQLKGYLESEWDTTLDAAGYPRSPVPGVKPRVTDEKDKVAKKEPTKEPAKEATKEAAKK